MIYQVSIASRLCVAQCVPCVGQQTCVWVTITFVLRIIGGKANLVLNERKHFLYHYFYFYKRTARVSYSESRTACFTQSRGQGEMLTTSFVGYGVGTCSVKEGFGRGRKQSSSCTAYGRTEIVRRKDRHRRRQKKFISEAPTNYY